MGRVLGLIWGIVVSLVWPAYGQSSREGYASLNEGPVHYVNDDWGKVGFAYRGNGLFYRIVSPHQGAASLAFYVQFVVGTGRVYVLYKIHKDAPGVRVIDGELTQTGAITIPNPAGYYQVGVEDCVSCEIFIDYRQGPFYK